MYTCKRLNHILLFASKLHLPGDRAEIVLGHQGSAKVPPGGKMAESRSMALDAFSGFVPPGGNVTEE